MPNPFLGAEDPTTAWAQAAVSGKMVVGEFVRGQAERHLRDIRDGEKRGIFWRPDAAAHALGFMPAVLSVTDGPSAGQPFFPLSWHTFVVGSLFGWRTATDRLRFRSAWLETGKGQAKSPLMAAIGLYIMGWFEIPRAQIFALGNDKATAKILYREPPNRQFMAEYSYGLGRSGALFAGLAMSKRNRLDRQKSGETKGHRASP